MHLRRGTCSRTGGTECCPSACSLRPSAARIWSAPSPHAACWGQKEAALSTVDQSVLRSYFVIVPQFFPLHLCMEASRIGDTMRNPVLLPSPTLTFRLIFPEAWIHKRSPRAGSRHCGFCSASRFRINRGKGTLKGGRAGLPAQCLDLRFCWAQP